MDILDFAGAVAIGNIVTLSIVFSFREFCKHDHNASWLAYIGFLLPTAILIGMLLTHDMPPQLDALVADR